MNWTIKKPEKDGWYWYRKGQESPEVILGYALTESIMVYICYGIVEWPDHTSNKIEDINGIWYGPLEPPQGE